MALSDINNEGAHVMVPTYIRAAALPFAVN